MSSPARSSASAASGGQGGGISGASGVGDDTATTYHFPADLLTVHDRKKEALAVLRSDLMEALQKEVKSLDDDSWMFAGPRSKINLISRRGGNLHMKAVKPEEHHHFKQTRKVQS